MLPGSNFPGTAALLENEAKLTKAVQKGQFANQIDILVAYVCLLSNL